MKDGTYNFTYNDCQIGRIKIGKKSFKMQIVTKDTCKWIENLTMKEYISNLDKWVKYTKQLNKY